ncbi:MAG: hypothetical protein IJU75_02180 [Clostridia bacterium]|nr:hypothetical protein [Clostridia bacterium]
MKKIISVFLVIAMIAAFAACQNPGNIPAGTSGTPSETKEKPSGDSSKKEEATAHSEEVTTVKDEETAPKEDETSAAEEEYTVPVKRTIYSTDTRNKIELFDHGVNANVVGSYNLGKGYVTDGVFDSDGMLEAPDTEWDKIFIASSTEGARKTNDGEHTYFPFVSYTRDLVINEFILGDVTHWIADDFGDYTLFTDYDRLELWYTSNPNGVWTKWDCVCEPFENPDNGELWGTYAQGIRFKGDDITARYFVVRAVDPQPDELLFVCNYAAPAAVYNPPPAD